MSRPRRFRIGAPFAAVLGTVLAIALVARAHDTDLFDPDDTRGKLDVQRVRLRHDGTPPFWSVITFGTWRVREMWDRGYVMVLLDTQQGEAADYYLLVRSNGRAMEGSLWRARVFGPDSRLGDVPVRRLSRRSVSVQVGLHRLIFGDTRLFYRWWVHTTFTNDVCRRTCHDRAPDMGGILQWRPGMSPSPSETPSPSP